MQNLVWMDSRLLTTKIIFWLGKRFFKLTHFPLQYQHFSTVLHNSTIILLIDTSICLLVLCLYFPLISPTKFYHVLLCELQKHDLGSWVVPIAIWYQQWQEWCKFLMSGHMASKKLKIVSAYVKYNKRRVNATSSRHYLFHWRSVGASFTNWTGMDWIW